MIAPGSRAESGQSTPDTILIVEDQPEMREALEHLLGPRGYRLLSCSTGEQALGYLEEADLVLLDVMLPGRDGWDICREIKRRDPELSVIVLTARVESEAVARSFECGADDYVSKPFRSVDLLARVESRLEMSRVRRGLGASEARFRTLISSMDDLVFTLDHEQRHTAVFGGWLERNRMDPQTLIGKRPSEVFSAEAGAIHEDAGRRALAGEPTSCRYSLRVAGEEFFFHTSFSPLSNGDGEVIGTVGVGRDITSVASAEALLREREAYFRALTENAADMVAVLAADGTILYQSPSSLRVIGFLAEELLGRSAVEFVHPEDLAHVRQEFSRLASGPQGVVASLEFRFRHRDGGWRMVAAEARNLLSDPTVHGIVLNTRDVTEQRRAELHYRRLVETSPNAIFVLDRDGYITECNAALSGMLGRRIEELDGRHFLEFVVPAERERVTAAFVERKAGGSGVRESEVRVQLPGGESRIIEIVTAAVMEDGVLLGVHGVARDVTEQKQAEATIRENEERFRFLAEFIPQLVWSATPDGYHDFFNGRWYDYTGMSRDDTQRSNWTSFLHPDDYDSALKLWQHSLDTGEPYEINYRWKRASDGTYRWFIGRALPLRDADGRIVRWFGTCTDVHEERTVGDTLRESEERYRLMVEGSEQVVFYTHDMQGIFTYVSPTVQQVLGYSKSEMIGRSYEELLHESERQDEVRTRTNVALETGTPSESYTMVARHREGRAVVLEVVESPLLRDGVVIGLQGFGRDITERRRAEEQIRFQAELLGAVAEAVIATDLQGKVLFFNRFAEELYGWRAEEAVGKDIVEVAPYEKMREESTDLMARLRAGDSWSGEFQVRRRDGSVFPARVTESPIMNDEGQLVGIVGISSDISERKSLEEQLRQAQKMEAVGRLAGGIAHDFNNLLMVIGGSTDFVLDDLPTESPFREDLEQIRKASEKAATLTQQLLAFSRKQVLQPQILDLNDIVEGTQKLLRRLIGEDVEIVVNLSMEAGRVEADPAQMDQVLINLAVNARDAMPTGGTLRLSTRTRVVTKDCPAGHPDEVPPGEYVVLSVQDSGCGMTEEAMAHIFEPFFTTKEQGKGTGLGLATVYGIIKQSGGYITVESAPDEGTTFDILLPRAAAETRQVSASLKSDLAAGGQTILVVEDDAAVRNLIRRVLERADYEVLEASDGEKALQVAAAFDGEIHLLLTDVVMPKLGGRVLSERLTSSRPGIRVLFMSGYTDDAILHHGMRHSEADLIQKPLEINLFLARVRELLGSEPTCDHPVFK